MLPPRPTVFEQATRSWILAGAGAIFALCMLLWHDGTAWTAWWLTGRWHLAAADVPLWRRHSPPEWNRRARRLAEDGDFRLALVAVNAGLEWSQDESEALTFQGNMRESLFQFRDAETSYENALLADPSNRKARANLVLCQRINRIRRDPGAQSSTLYALHRVMLEQGRVSEDLAIGRMLSSDRVLWQAAWQAALDRTGLQGRLTVNESGAMELDLTGERQPDLRLIKDFPITGLNVAYTGLADIRALAGMSLEKLDLTQTVVEDLSPLHGMPLKVLSVARTGVVDLAPLADSPLVELDISRTQVFDLAALARLSLTTLRANDTPINDLAYLSGVPLTALYLNNTRVKDLTPLSHLPLEVLALDGTGVSDLLPLKGSQLHSLYLSSTAVSDLTPLADTPLKILTLSNCERVTDMRPLISCLELEHLLLPPRAQFVEMLSALPRLRFIQRAEMNVDAMLL